MHLGIAPWVLIELLEDLSADWYGCIFLDDGPGTYNPCLTGSTGSEGMAWNKMSMV